MPNDTGNTRNLPAALVHRSTDGGERWTSLRIDPNDVAEGLAGTDVMASRNEEATNNVASSLTTDRILLEQSAPSTNQVAEDWATRYSSKTGICFLPVLIAMPRVQPSLRPFVGNSYNFTVAVFRCLIDHVDQPNSSPRT